MVNLGMDFGSTYTTVSIYREDTKKLEALILGQGVPYIPSVAAMGKGEIFYGSAAKNKTGRKGYIIYKSFKMLLTETDKAKLQERGFDTINTPEYITKIFIENVLSQVLTDLHETEITNLFIGVPEIWNEGFGTLDGRTLIRDICRSLEFVKNVKVISEPAAASAFFAHNFFISTRRNFEGNILLVDYGGGTLDITLTQTAVSEQKEENHFMELKVLERTGAGENEEGRIGKAAVVYMETVVCKAIRQAGLADDKEPKYDGLFFRAVDELEMELQTSVKKIQNVFEEYGVDYPEELYEEEFTTVEYNHEEVRISYGLLLEVYNDIIRDVFDEKLNKMIDYMETAGIRYMDGNQDIFKIALVGGFGNFYLVRRQIVDKFKLGSNDKRQENIILDKAGCERAISLGAALLAAGVIGIRNTAPYSIGVWAYDVNKKVCMNYAIHYKQDIEFNAIYYAKGSVDGEIFVIQAVSGGFDKFLVNFGYDDSTACFALIKEEFAKKLSNVIKNQYHTAVVGFSIDSSGVVSIHIHDYDILTGNIGEEDHVIELTRFNELFKIADVGQFAEKGGQENDIQQDAYYHGGVGRAAGNDGC